MILSYYGAREIDLLTCSRQDKTKTRQPLANAFESLCPCKIRAPRSACLHPRRQVMSKADANGTLEPGAARDDDAGSGPVGDLPGGGTEGPHEAKDMRHEAQEPGQDSQGPRRARLATLEQP